MTRFRKPLVFLVAFFLSSAFAETGNDPKLSGIEVKVEDADAKLVFGTKVGFLFTDQLQASDNPTCRAAAVLVAQEALEKYGYWTKFFDVFKKTAEGVKTVADAAGAKSVSKVAQLAGTIAEAFDDEQPAAALGRAILNEASDWLSKKIPESNVSIIDDAVKEKAEDAKLSLIHI